MLDVPETDTPEKKKISWKDWTPSLDNGDLTLGEVHETLPGNNPDDISAVIRLFENPESPIAFKGAINLPRHDCVHIVLGRGLLPQDEAFVIGYTMGTSKNISLLESWLFSLITRYIYPHPYKFDEAHQKVLKMAIEAGKQSKVQKIYEFPFENCMDVKLKDLRKIIGVSVEELKAFYRVEQILIPDTKESKRLPV